MAWSSCASIVLLLAVCLACGCGSQAASAGVPPVDLVPLVSEAMRSQRIAAYLLKNPVIASAQTYTLDDLRVDVRGVDPAADGATCSAKVRLQGSCTIAQALVKPTRVDGERPATPPGGTTTSGVGRPIHLPFALTRTILFERDANGRWAVAAPAQLEIPATAPRPRGNAP